MATPRNNDANEENKTKSETTPAQKIETPKQTPRKEEKQTPRKEEKQTPRKEENKRETPKQTPRKEESKKDTPKQTPRNGNEEEKKKETPKQTPRSEKQNTPRNEEKKDSKVETPKKDEHVLEDDGKGKKTSVTLFVSVRGLPDESNSHVKLYALENGNEILLQTSDLILSNANPDFKTGLNIEHWEKQDRDLIGVVEGDKDGIILGRATFKLSAFDGESVEFPLLHEGKQLADGKGVFIVKKSL